MKCVSLQRWLLVCDQLGCDAGAKEYRAVLRGWRSWGRHYHSIVHLDACLSGLDAVRGQAAHPAEVEMALWYHDAVYRTWRSDNEARSADWAVRVLKACGSSSEVVARVSAAILATRHGDAVPVGDTALVVDIDLGILGQSDEVYQQFASNVRREYWWVPRRRYAVARCAVLEGFLRRPSIYHHAWFRDRFESQARVNMAGEIERLRSDK